MPKYETVAGLPTKGITYAKLLEHLREAQDCCAMMSHLHTENTDIDRTLAKGWLGIEELLKRMAYQVTRLATRNMS